MCQHFKHCRQSKPPFASQRKPTHYFNCVTRMENMVVILHPRWWYHHIRWVICHVRNTSTTNQDLSSINLWRMSLMCTTSINYLLYQSFPGSCATNSSKGEHKNRQERYIKYDYISRRYRKPGSPAFKTWRLWVTFWYPMNNLANTARELPASCWTT